MTLYKSSNSIEEMHELLVAGLELPNLGMVKIELNHPILNVDSLIAKLNEPHPRS